MSLKIGINLVRNYSINFSLPKRRKKLIQFIIIHYTGMRKESEAIKRLCDFRSKVSCHYLIKNNGEILSIVPDLYESWHAGKSNWGGFKSLNKYSIGIEISNPGHNHGYIKFNFRQINSLEKLLSSLIKKYKIKTCNILGHSDIAPNRKLDPGEKFPWSRLFKKKLCLWHRLNPKKLSKYRGLKVDFKDEKEFLQNLYKIGYPKNKSVKNGKILTTAFQRRFRQNKINGKIDKECLFISKNLVKS